MGGLAGQIRGAGFEVLRVPHEGMISARTAPDRLRGAHGRGAGEHGPAAQVKTLAHELAHVLMHDPDDEEARQHRGIREVEAESVALMIGAAHGMDTAGYTIPYVSTWAARVDGQEPSRWCRPPASGCGRPRWRSSTSSTRSRSATAPTRPRPRHPGPRTSRAAAPAVEWIVRRVHARRQRWRRAEAVMPEAFDVPGGAHSRGSFAGLGRAEFAAAGVPVFPCLVEGKRP